MADAMVFEAFGTAAVPESLLTDSRAAASAVGYAHGWAQGMREARATMVHESEAARTELRQDVDERHAALQLAVHAMANAAKAVEANSLAVTAQIEDAIARGAVLIAEALIGRELADDAEATRTAIGRALQLTPQNEPVTVRVNDHVYAALAPADTTALLASVSETVGRSVTLQPDTTLEPADAIATCGATTIDARLSGAVARVRDRLTR